MVSILGQNVQTSPELVKKNPNQAASSSEGPQKMKAKVKHLWFNSSRIPVSDDPPWESVYCGTSPISLCCLFSVLVNQFLFTENQAFVGVGGEKGDFLGEGALGWKGTAIHYIPASVFSPLSKLALLWLFLTCLHSVSDLYTHVSCISDDSNYTLGNKSLIKCGNKLWKDIMHGKKMY